MLRFYLSWILFYAGDLVSKLLNFDEFGFLYLLYNNLMRVSLDIQGDGVGPWEQTEAPSELDS